MICPECKSHDMVLVEGSGVQCQDCGTVEWVR